MNNLKRVLAMLLAMGTMSACSGEQTEETAEEEPDESEND